MDLYPAIDLRGGQVVRLAQGDYARETVYGTDPVAVALHYEAAGAPWVHVVDLDAARQQGSNRDKVRAVAAAVGVPVQSGGGVRTVADADELVDAGVARLVVGTAAFREPGFVAELCRRHAGRVAVDVAAGSDGNVAIAGWEETGDEPVTDAIRRLAAHGVAAFVVTSVAHDGMLNGPDIALVEAAVEATDVPVIASGGVGLVEDLVALRRAGAAGAIVGRALFEGRFSLEEAVRACGS